MAVTDDQQTKMIRAAVSECFARWHHAQIVEACNYLLARIDVLEDTRRLNGNRIDELQIAMRRYEVMPARLGRAEAVVKAAKECRLFCMVKKRVTDANCGWCAECRTREAVADSAKAGAGEVRSGG